MSPEEIIKRVRAAHQECGEALNGNLETAGRAIAKAELFLDEIVKAHSCTHSITRKLDGKHTPCGGPSKGGIAGALCETHQDQADAIKRKADAERDFMAHAPCFDCDDLAHYRDDCPPHCGECREDWPCEASMKRCPHDGGKCHHSCKDPWVNCFRASGGGTLSKPHEGYPLPGWSPPEPKFHPVGECVMTTGEVTPEREGKGQASGSTPEVPPSTGPVRHHEMCGDPLGCHPDCKVPSR